MNRIRSNLTFANAVSLIALFVALGARATPRCWRRTPAQADQEERRQGVRDQGPRRGDERGQERVVFAGDFKAAIPAGPKGDKGDTGETGTFGTVTTQFQQATVALADNTSASYHVFCPTGERGIGGGARGDATDSEFTNVTSSRPAMSLANTEPPGDMDVHRLADHRPESRTSEARPARTSARGLR